MKLILKKVTGSGTQEDPMVIKYWTDSGWKTCSQTENHPVKVWRRRDYAEKVALREQQYYNERIIIQTIL